jgi:hypothetical protein
VHADCAQLRVQAHSTHAQIARENLLAVNAQTNQALQDYHTHQKWRVTEGPGQWLQAIYYRGYLSLLIKIQHLIFLAAVSPQSYALLLLIYTLLF